MADLKAARLAKLQAWQAQQAAPPPKLPPAPAQAPAPPVAPPQAPQEGLLNEEGDEVEVDPLDAFMAAEVRRQMCVPGCLPGGTCHARVCDGACACAFVAHPVCVCGRSVASPRLVRCAVCSTPVAAAPPFPALWLPTGAARGRCA